MQNHKSAPMLYHNSEDTKILKLSNVLFVPRSKPKGVLKKDIYVPSEPLFRQVKIFKQNEEYFL